LPIGQIRQLHLDSAAGAQQAARGRQLIGLRKQAARRGYCGTS
jgi:hypothetical protein